MRLSDFIKLPGKQVSDKTENNVSVDAARTAQVNRQIKAMIPGQTIQGEIVAKSGGEVQIRLADDMVLTAHLDHNINLEIGKGMIFQVMNNGSSLTLSPLFANTATDANVFKALDMAGLSVNDTTVFMTQSMMEAGLSIDKQSLQNMYREINAHPQTDIKNIIDLHKLGLPVNEENLAQIASYKNLTHQLVNGMTHVLDEIPMTMQNLIQNGNMEGAVQLFQALTGQIEGLFQETMNAGMPEGTLTDVSPGAPTDISASAPSDVSPGVQSNAAPDVPLSEAGTKRQIFSDNVLQGNVLPEDAVSAGMEGNLSMEEKHSMEKGRGPEAAVMSAADDTGNVPMQDGSLAIQDTGRLQGLLEQLQIPAAERQLFSEQLTQLQQGTLNNQEILQLVNQMLQAAMKTPGRSSDHMGALLTDKALNNLLTDMMKDSWTIRPGEVQNKENVDALYNRLNRQLNSLSEVLDHVGQSGSSMAKSVSNMTQNLNFLHQLNQMYTYVQLPLKMSQDTAHGDLYVYANKKHLAASDGNISALLHLDMENLGPVDVYVSMQNNMEGSRSKVNTRFYLRDDEILDFLSEHMDILNRRLKERGYDMQCEMTIREPSQKSNPVGVMLQESASGIPLVQYAFDVRA